LEPFHPGDEPLVAEVIKQAVDGLDYYLLHGIDKTMTRFNTRHMNMPQVEGKAAQV
jgi:hypothetical protein